MKFLDLVTHIAEVDDVSRMSAGRLVQQALSLRNWIIGAGVVEFEQSGEDRAAYGERLLLRLTDALTSTGCKGLSARNLKNFRQVALAYAGLDGFGMGRRLGLFQSPSDLGFGRRLPNPRLYCFRAWHGGRPNTRIYRGGTRPG